MAMPLSQLFATRIFPAQRGLETIGLSNITTNHRRSNSTESNKNHSVYNFKNNYFSNLSQADSEFINPASQSSEDGKIIHDIDIIAEKMIYNSSVLGPQGEEDLKRLHKIKIPLPTLYDAKYVFLREF